MKYQGVDTDHPRIVDAIKTLVAQGKDIDTIAAIVGMPHEIVRKYTKEYEHEKK